jgi:hypothetical protein
MQWQALHREVYNQLRLPKASWIIGGSRAQSASCHACQQLATAVRLPGFLSYGRLKLLPFWDPLRGDPRFAKIVASLAPK